MRLYLFKESVKEPPVGKENLALIICENETL